MTAAAQIESVAREILRATSPLPRRIAWRDARKGCRDILKQLRRPEYAASVDAEYDRDWLLDLLPDVLPASDKSEEEPAGEWGS